MKLIPLLFIFLMPVLLSGQALSSKKEARKAIKLNRKAKKDAIEATEQLKKALKAKEEALKQKETALCLCNPRHDLYLKEHYSYLQSKKELEEKQTRYEEKKQSSDQSLEDLAAQIVILKETLAEKKIALEERGLLLARRTAIRSVRASDFNMKAALAKEAYSLYLTSDGSSMDAYIYEAIYSTLYHLEETNNNNPNFNTLNQAPEGHIRLGRIRSIKVGKGNTNFYTNNSDGLLLKWKYNSDSTLFKDKSNKPNILSNNREVNRSLDISPDGKQLARAGDGDKILITDTKSGQVVKELCSHRGSRIWDLKYMPDGKAIITTEDDGFGGTSINYTTLDDISSFMVEKSPYRLRHLAISSDGKYLAGVGKSSEVWVWDLADQCHEFTLSCINDKHATAVAFSPHGRFIVVGYQTGRLAIWDMNKMKWNPNYSPVMLLPHRASISDLEFNKSGTSLLVGSLDKTATLWTIHNKKYTGENKEEEEFPYLDPSYSPIYFKHDDWVTAVAFSHDDTKTITGSANGKLKLWEIDPGVYFNRIYPFVKTLDTEGTYNVWYKYIGIDTDGVSLNEEELYLEYLKHSNKVLSLLK